MANLSKPTASNVSTLDQFCDEKELPGFNRILDNHYDNNLDGWYEQSDSDIRAAHQKLVTLVFTAGFTFEQVEEYVDNI